MHELVAIVKGRVQGVMYRTYVQDSATELELTGYVENLPDGSVEVVAQGPKDVLLDFVEYLHEGSSLSKVETVSVDWQTPKVTYDEFSIKHL